MNRTMTYFTANDQEIEVMKINLQHNSYIIKGETVVSL